MVIDTNIVIACLNGDKIADALAQWKADGRALFISSITVAETLALPKLNPAEILKIQGFLGNFISIPFDDSVAEFAASLRRKYGLEIPDAGIVATALIHNLPLATRDTQFLKVKEVKVVNI